MFFKRCSLRSWRANNALKLSVHGANGFAIGVAPSILGPAGLLFLLLSSSGRVSRFSLGQVTLLVAASSLTLELVQLLPRPGLLARAHYTFDYNDLFASAVSVALAYVVATVILRKLRPIDERS